MKGYLGLEKRGKLKIRWGDLIAGKFVAQGKGRKCKNV